MRGGAERQRNRKHPDPTTDPSWPSSLVRLNDVSRADVAEASPLLGQLVIGGDRIDRAGLDAHFAVYVFLGVVAELLGLCLSPPVRRQVDALDRHTSQRLSLTSLHSSVIT
jgi:hypothetical protein